MPIYEYRCADCQQVFEEWQKDFEQRDKTCPVCGGHGKRLVSSTSFILKGSGWYVTDYSRGSHCTTNGTANKESGSTESATSTPSTSDSSPADTGQSSAS